MFHVKPRARPTRPRSLYSRLPTLDVLPLDTLIIGSIAPSGRKVLRGQPVSRAWDSASGRKTGGCGSSLGTQRWATIGVLAPW
jgi:hypothetical protein